MSNSFETVEAILAATPLLSEMLRDAHRYRAHVHPKYPPELYEEHFDRVNKHFGLICQKNGLDDLVDNMVVDYVRSCFPKSDFQKTSLYIKKLFVSTAVFHDFGKVNENFQGHPKKMNNPEFRMHRDNPLKHHHSKLGAYLYVVRHFEEAQKMDFIVKEEQRQFFLTILLFSYSIFKHHAAGLLRPDSQGIRFEPEELAWMKKYLAEYRMTPDERIAGPMLEQKVLEQQFFDWVFKTEKIQFRFSFFALLRLNFSLLTAADYLATGEYSYGLKLETDEDWGIFGGDNRESLVNAPRTNAEKGYNIAAYELFEKIKSGERSFQNPQDASEENLNTLRTEMAVGVLQTLEKNRDTRLFYLEAPTGGGKTNLSMLAVAELFRADPRLTKVFYVFPFTTLITQTHQAVKETLLLDDSQIALLHSRAGFQTVGEKTGDEEEDALYGGQRRDFLQNLFALYPFSLVTHVRFFDILKSNRKDDIYLMHRLANSVVVLDELQSYNPRHWDKMAWLLEQYGKFFNIRFILMSATLPRLDRIEAVKAASGDEMPDFIDLLPNAKTYFQNPNFGNRVTFKFDLLAKGELTADELATEVLEKSRSRAAANDGRVFTIVEFIFKKSATEFRSVLERFEPLFDEIFVLSGTILESRRRQIIYYLKRQRKARGLKILLITTQVVEAGVDIDMDLGFKNVSLIDSDEQLAGRVNRNVGKRGCEVWLFQKDDASVLYGSDFRFQATRELSRTVPDFHRAILEKKDFERLYHEVLKKIDTRNQSQNFTNFNDYLQFLKKLDFPKIADTFKIIDQQTLSVFVPVSLPLEIENHDGKPESFFNLFELDFLEKAKDYGVVGEGGKTVNGASVWKLYRETLSNPNADFIAKKIEQKVMQGILAKFTFSMFDSPKNRTKLASNSDPSLSLENYFYLSRWKEDGIYSVENGLDESKLEDPII